jgi:hypothetical protein
MERNGEYNGYDFPDNSSELKEDVPEKFGTKSSLLTILFGLVLLYSSYFVLKPLGRTTIFKAQIHISRADFRHSETPSRKDYIEINSHDRSLEMGYALWKGRYKTSEILRGLNKPQICTIWLRDPDDTHILGIRAGRIFIPPEVGTKLQNSNRTIGIGLGYFFVVLGIVTIIMDKTGK